MSTYQLSAVALVCDGCGVEFGISGEYGSAMEARAAAYSTAGWRFPRRVRNDGSPSRGARADDVCSRCIEGWVPMPAHAKRR